MPIILILLAVAAAAYVVTRPKAAPTPVPPTDPTDRSTGIHRAPVDFHRETVMTSTTGSRGTVITGGSIVPGTGEGAPSESGSHLDIARILIRPELRSIQYEKAGGATDTPFTSLVGDIQVKIQGEGTGYRARPGAGRIRTFLISSISRGERVNSISHDDPMGRSSYRRSILDIEGHTTAVFDQRDSVPEHIADIPAFIAPLHMRNSELRLVKFMLDLCDAVGIQDATELVILGDSSELYRAEVALKGRVQVWREVVRIVVPMAASVLSTVASTFAVGAALSPVTQAIIGIVKRAVTISMDIATRRNKLEAIIGNAISLMTPADIIGIGREIMTYNVQSSLETGVSGLPVSTEKTRVFINALTQVNRLGAMREAGISSIPAFDTPAMLRGLEAEKLIAASISGSDLRCSALSAAIGSSGQPYRLREVKIFT